MKKYTFLFVSFLVMLCIGLFSFSSNGGGDVFAIYFNGRQVHRQFVHIDHSVKALQLNVSGANDKVEVFYSHCGKMGTSRTLTLKNERNELIKELKFADADDDKSLMGFYPATFAKAQNVKVNLYYASKELPEGKLLATINWNDQKLTAQR
jgi:hypothetical protein